MSSTEHQHLMRLDPKIDLVFKRIFGTQENEDLLLSLLNAILQRPDGEQLVRLELLNPFVEGEWLQEKLSILDIRARDQQEQLYNIEIQCANQSAFIERILYYWARLYSSQLKSGETYTKLRPVISVVLTDFDLLEESNNYHSCFMLQEVRLGTLLTRALEFHLLELSKMKVERSDTPNPLERWLLFLTKGQMMEREELFPWQSPEIEKAFDELERLSRDPAFRWKYEERYKGLMDYASAIQDYFLKGEQIGLEKGEQIGLEKGEAKGRQEERVQLARRMLQQGLSTKQVAAITGLDLSEIEGLR